MSAVSDALAAAIPTAQLGVTADGLANVVVPKEALLDVARRLRDELGYNRFVDLTCVDAPDEEERFELQYLFYSMEEHTWLRLKVRTAEAVPSVTPTMPAADWYEREVYDLFGVRFDGHPNLTRIMLPDDWDGHPLRRDAVLQGEPVDFTVTRDIYGMDAPPAAEQIRRN